MQPEFFSNLMLNLNLYFYDLKIRISIEVLTQEAKLRCRSNFPKSEKVAKYTGFL